MPDLKKNGGKPFGKMTKREVRGVGEITFIYVRNLEGNLIELQSCRKASLQHRV